MHTKAALRAGVVDAWAQIHSNGILWATVHTLAALAWSVTFPFAKLRCGVPDSSLETCEQCGGAVEVIASIEDPVVIRSILDHVERRANSTQPLPHPARGPPLAPSPDRS